MRGAALAAALAVGLFGCGGDDESTAPQSSSTELDVSLDVDGPGGEPPREASLSCPDTDSAACDAVAGLPRDPAAPVPPQTACTEIFGGPEVVTLSGTLRGESIDASLTRADGCQIERFNRFTRLLQELFPDYRPGEALIQ